MPGIIPQPILDDIRAQNDLVDLIGAYVPLKRAGSSFRALCPFHKEKTPSFHVNPQRQIYHCFGCGAGGDAFKFIMQYEGVDFVGAVRLLARRANIPLEFTGENAKGGTGADKDRLFKLNEEIAGWFNRMLLEYAGADAAREYLLKRDLGPEMVRSFLIGYAPDSWDALRQWGEKKKYSVRDLEAAGLVSAAEETGAERRYYARFRHRLMFPIRDELGRVVGFSGRLLNDAEKAAKYVNTPETALFKKGRLLFGLDKARRAIVDSRRAILCEGQIDTIRCHAAGITTAVAPQGTAFTEEQAVILKRYADEVVLVFDADAAGQTAAQRSAEICLGAGLSVLVASLSGGKDPDEFIREKGGEAFLQLVAQGKTLLDYQIGQLSSQEDLTREAGLLRVARAVLETIARAPSEIQRDQLLHQAAGRLGLSEESLRREFRRLTQRRRGTTAPQPPPADAATSHPPEEVMLLEILVAQPELLETVRHYLPLNAMQSEGCRTILGCLLESGDPGQLMNGLRGAGEECQRLAAQVQAAPQKIIGTELSAGHAVQDIILRLRRGQLEGQRQSLQARRKAEGVSDAQREHIQLECHQITMDIQALKSGWDRALPVLEVLKA